MQLWTGIVTDERGVYLTNVTIVLRASAGDKEYRATTQANGTFAFSEIKIGSYRVSVAESRREWTATELLVVPEDEPFSADIQLSKQGHTIAIIKRVTPARVETEQGIRLSSKEVSTLPLNERDFSKLLAMKPTWTGTGLQVEGSSRVAIGTKS